MKLTYNFSSDKQNGAYHYLEFSEKVDNEQQLTYFVSLVEKAKKKLMSPEETEGEES